MLTVALMYNFLGQIRLSQGDNDRAAQLFSAGLDAPAASRTGSRS